MIVSAQEAIAVIYDAEDARRFLAERPGASAILALTPDAQAALQGAAERIIASNEGYGPFAHRRALARVRRARRDLEQHMESEALPPSATETLLNAFDLVAFMTARLHETMRGSVWLVPSPDDWRIHTRQGDAVSNMLQRLSAAPWWPVAQPPPLQPLVACMNRMAARSIAHRRPIVFSNFDRGFGPFLQMVNRFDTRAAAVSFTPPSGRWRDVLRSAAALLGVATGRRTLRFTCVMGAEPPELRKRLLRCLDSVKDPVLRRGIDVFRAELIGNAIASSMMASALADLFREMQPRALTAYTLRWRLDSALGEAAGEAGVPRLLLSHGSHTPPEGVVAAAAVDGHARGLLVSRFADMTYTQSPHADAAALRLMPDLPRQRVNPVVWGYEPVTGTPAPRFRILHAGTLKAWRDHRPWMYETSDEFVSGLKALSDAVAKLETTCELVIRVRPQPECSIETLAALLPKRPNVTIKSSGSFLDDLAEADLLVSYSSTTIEEALRARRPVLLWGGGCPYRHLPGRTDFPRPNDRSAVYAVDAAGRLSGMIAAIASAHHGRPLTDEELSGHAWPPGSPGAAELAARLAAMAGISGCASVDNAWSSLQASDCRNALGIDER